MNISKIAVRYAKSLFLIAEEKKQLEDIKNDMALISDICDTIPEFMLMIESPVIKLSKKQSVFTEIFKSRISELSLQFLLLISKNKRDIYIKDIVRNYIQLYKNYFGIKSAVLITASSVDDSTRNNISQMIQKAFNTNVELTEHIDSEIIGGFILKVEDQQIDASVTTKLTKIKQNLINSSI